jgi:hypothetical protein
MEIGNIVQGHVNEFLGLNKNLQIERLKVCEKCPLLKRTFLGLVCNSNLYLNPETNDVSDVEKENYVNGCGCRLSAKTSGPQSKCPANKW